MAKVYQMKGVNSSARQELGQALQFSPELLPARLELARMLIAGDAPKAALDLLSPPATPTDQTRALPLISLRNWALFGLGDVANFRKGVSDALVLGRTPDVLLQNAIVKLQQRDVAGARASIDEALAKNPRDSRPLELLVTTYRVQKQPEAVLPKLREVAAKYPNSPEVQNILGDWLLSTGDLAKAREAFSTALKLEPHSVAGAVGLARADAAAGKLDDARKTLVSMSLLEPGNGTVTLLMGNVEEKSGNLGRALELYTKVLETDPSNVQALNNAAYLLADYAHKPDEALKYAQRAKELSPESASVDDTLGWVLYKKGLYSAAITHLEQASNKLKVQVVPQYHLSMAYFKSGDNRRGSQVLQTALQRNPNVPEAAMARQVQAESLKVGR
jgi:Tfp pilus assembly protein PilF